MTQTAEGRITYETGKRENNLMGWEEMRQKLVNRTGRCTIFFIIKLFQSQVL